MLDAQSSVSFRCRCEVGAKGVRVGSWLLARWRLCAMVAVALVVGLVATLALVHVSAPASSEAIDCSVVEAASFDEAGARAAQCEVEIEVIEARTSWTTTWATPEGYNRIEHTASPSRTNVTGTWTDIDTSLTVDEETGSVVAEAPVYAIELSGGDAAEEGTLGSITREGRRVELGFPVPLPEPEVVGSQAFYALGDGIRLIVTVNDDGTGFFPVIELGSPDAAERFAVLLTANGAGDGFELEFPVSLPPGLRLETEGTTAKVVDEAGESHFVVPTPLMWDSAASELPNADLEEQAHRIIPGPNDLGESEVLLRGVVECSIAGFC